MFIESSNLSHAEYFHLNGVLSEDRTASVLVELEEALECSVVEYAPYAEEARSGFASEDFMQEEVSDLHYFAKRLRGSNKEELRQYIENIENKLQELRGQVEYGNEQLSKIIATIRR